MKPTLPNFIRGFALATICSYGLYTAVGVLHLEHEASYTIASVAAATYCMLREMRK